MHIMFYVHWLLYHCHSTVSIHVTMILIAEQLSFHEPGEMKVPGKPNSWETVVLLYNNLESCFNLKKKGI